MSNLPKSRQEALARNSPHYFTNVPCKNGHVSLRFTSSKGCVECHRARQQTQAYKDKKEEWASSEAQLAKQRERRKTAAWRDKHRTHMQTPKARARREARRLWRMENDPHYRVKILLRSRFNSARKRFAISGSAIRDLGMTIPDFIQYCQSLPTWNPEWEWTDLGVKFHIDHIKPLGLFDLTDPAQRAVALNYRNLQPLSNAEHVIKSVADRELIRQLYAEQVTAD